MSTYRHTTVPVTGGELSVGVWESTAPEAPVLLALHGITSNHLAWTLLAQKHPNVTIIAPDLRGRARSSSLPRPYGMRQHSEDIAAVLDHFGHQTLPVVGHSMGAFVAVIFSALNPGRAGNLLLIDGGLPIRVPGNLSGEELITQVLGPVAQRLGTVFPSREAYTEHWKAHPAFLSDWNELLPAYANYDLNEVAEGFQPSTQYPAMLADSEDLYGSSLLSESLAALVEHTVFLRAPLGLFNEPPGLYPREQAEQAAAELNNFEYHEISEVNHYTILMADHGVEKITPYFDALIHAPLRSS